MDIKVIDKILTNSYKNEELSHAYIFYGGSNKIKYDEAIKLSKLLLKTETPETHANFYYVFDEKNIKKEMIVTALKNFSKTALVEGKRVFLINNAEKMNAYSQNSLLKFLENPSKDTTIILITNNIESLLQTIKSRSNMINFSYDKTKELKELLKDYDKTDVDIALNCKADYDSIVMLLNDTEYNNIVNLCKICVKDPIEALKYHYSDSVLDKTNISYFFNIMIDHYMRIIKKDDLYFSSSNNDFETNKIILDFLVNKKQEFSANLNFPLALDVLFMKLGELI